MMAGEFAGRLRQRISVEQRVGGRDALGSAAGAWQLLATVWAAIEPDRSGDPSAADRVTSWPRYVVTLRRRDDLDLDCRVQWQGGVYRLCAIERDPALPDRMTLRVEQMA
jgi:head-tail adaptor